jgi:hypothetical protein
MVALAVHAIELAIQCPSNTSTRTTIPTLNSPRAISVHWITVRICDLSASRDRL